MSGEVRGSADIPPVCQHLADGVPLPPGRACQRRGQLESSSERGGRTGGRWRGGGRGGAGAKGRRVEDWMAEAGAGRLGTTAPWPSGAAWIGGRYCPVEQAKISVLDLGVTRSDAAYDVVHVWRRRFYRLDDHLDRFSASLARLRLHPR